MKTIAENANDFVNPRTADGGNGIYVDNADFFLRLMAARPLQNNHDENTASSR